MRCASNLGGSRLARLGLARGSGLARLSGLLAWHGRLLRAIDGGAPVVLTQAVLIGTLFLIESGERGAVDVLGKDRELSRLEGGVDHEAHEGLAHEPVALLVGLGFHKARDLACELRVERRHK